MFLNLQQKFYRHLTLSNWEKKFRWGEIYYKKNLQVLCISSWCVLWDRKCRNCHNQYLQYRIIMCAENSVSCFTNLLIGLYLNLKKQAFYNYNKYVIYVSLPISAAPRRRIVILRNAMLTEMSALLARIIPFYTLWSSYLHMFRCCAAN